MTDQVCDVSPFIDDYKPLSSVPIVTACTAWDNPNTGQTFILEFHQSLWFGSKLENSLINPNQCRNYGVSICDDPFDPNRSLSIYDHITEQDISLYMEGSTACLDTRVPSDKELEDCIYIVMTSDHPWNPNDVSRRVSATSNSHTDTYDVNVTAFPEDPQVSLDYPIGDQILASVSSSLSELTLSRRLVSSVNVGMSKATGRRARISPEMLSKKWLISIEQAKETLKATTQHNIRQPVHPLTRRFRTDLISDRYKGLRNTFYSDTAFSKVKSLRGNACVQLFSDRDFVWVHPMKSKSEAGCALQHFQEDVGTPRVLVVDGSQEQTGKKSEFFERTRKSNVVLRTTEPYTPRQNSSEGVIGRLKKKWRTRMLKSHVPTRLWDYGFVYESEIMNRTARGDNKLTAYERIAGETPDISEWMDYGFYDWVYFWDVPGDSENPKIGKWVGVSHRIGNALCYYILKDNGQVISRSTVQPIRREDIDPQVNTLLTTFTEKIEDKLSDVNYLVNSDGNLHYIDEVEDNQWEVFEGETEQPDIENDENEIFDNLIGAEVMLANGDSMEHGTVVKRLKDSDGNPIGRKHHNTILDTSQYSVEFSSGMVKEYAANTIAENMIAQCDSEGRQYSIFNGIVDHKKTDEAINKSDATFQTHTGQSRKRITTKGWKFLVEWVDGSEDWIPLKDLKASNPVELAEYAISHDIQDEPALSWWVKDTLKRRENIISKVKSKYWKTTHKFGIRLPHTIKQALEIDRTSQNNLWCESIMKEMDNVKPAFGEWDKDLLPSELRAKPQMLPGFKEIKCHMIFDIKMDGKFTRKSRLVAGGHMTDPPSCITYSSVVSRESVRIAFLLASLLDLKVLSADIGNAYLNANCREKIWFESGPEFGPEKEGKVMIIERALYGLKSSGAAWRSLLAQTMVDMDYRSTRADPDVWIRAQVKPDGTQYYEYCLIYVDDILCMSHDPESTMKELASLYRLKDDKVAPPDKYLGANIDRFQCQDGRVVWAMSSEEYVKNMVKNVEKILIDDGNREGLNSRGNKTPWKTDYIPEIDVTEVLESDLTTRYQNLIGMLRWSCELGRVDILHEVAKMSSYNAQPRVGHLQAVYKIFAYLKNHTRSRLVFDDLEVIPDPKIFQDVDWKDFYPDAEEILPTDMPTPRGPNLRISCFVDADHAGNVVTRRSHTGVLIYLNNTPISWYSKRQNTVESSTFGSEFNALRIAVDQVQALRYKLCMFGIAVDIPADMYCDNQSVTRNSSLPESTLSKKHNSVCYHRVREASAAGMIRVAWLSGEDNYADLFTKPLPVARRIQLLSGILY